MGYVPDPLLDAFNFHRLAAQPTRASPIIAFVSDMPSRAAFNASPLHQEAFAGAKTRANELGFGLDLFLTGSHQLSPARLDQVLQSRNISCVIMGLFGSQVQKLLLDWSRYCVIAVDSVHLQPGFDCVAYDYRTAVRRAVRRLRKAGHVRIGFVITTNEDVRLTHVALSGFLMEVVSEKSSLIPPLFLRSVPGEEADAKFDLWVKRFRPTSAVSGCFPVQEAVWKKTFGTSFGLTWGDLLPKSEKSATSRTPLHYRDLGAQAAELLSLRLHVNQRGISTYRTTIMLPAQADPPLDKD